MHIFNFNFFSFAQIGVLQICKIDYSHRHFCLRNKKCAM